MKCKRLFNPPIQEYFKDTNTGEYGIYKMKG